MSEDQGASGKSTGAVLPLEPAAAGPAAEPMLDPPSTASVSVPTDVPDALPALTDAEVADAREHLTAASVASSRSVEGAAAPPSSPSGVPPSRTWLAFVAGVAAVSLALGVQHFRHGWPFSLHHGIDAPAVPSRPAHGEHDGGLADPRVAVEVPAWRAAALGIATSVVGREELSAELRAVATVVPDESRVSHVHTRVSGWIDRLSVRTTGERVRAGQVLGAIFSRELLAAQTEYLAAVRAGAAVGGSGLARAAHDRLRVLGMTDGEVDALERRGEATQNVPILAPRAGVVLERGVTLGAAVDPSTDLFVIADLSEVWVLAEIPEARMAEIAVGAIATLELATSGVEALESSVAFVYPTLSEGTRTLRVRFVVPNPDGTIRPGAFGTAVFSLSPRTLLVVPRDAVVDRGTLQHVFVATDDGRYEPRMVRIGARFEDRVEILEGVSEGERVVSSGVFLLDSESRLRASGGSMAGMDHGASAPAEAEAEPSAPHDMGAMPRPAESGAASEPTPSGGDEMADMPGHAP